MSQIFSAVLPFLPAVLAALSIAGMVALLWDDGEPK